MFFRRILLYIYLCLASCKLRNWLIKVFAFYPSKIPTYQFREVPPVNVKSELANMESQISPSKMISEFKESVDDEVFRRVSRGQSMHHFGPSTFLEVDQVDTRKYQSADVRYDMYIQRKGQLNNIIDNLQNQIDIEGYYLDVKGVRIAVMVVTPLFAEAKVLILHSHPNQPDLGDMFEMYVNLCYNLNCVVVGYDYPGFGLSEGSPTEELINHSITAVYHFALSLNFDSSQIILYGHSIGCGPTIHLASQVSVGGVVLHSCYKSLLNVLCPHSQNYNTDVFKNYLLIDKIKSPIYMLHGALDQTTPVQQAYELSLRVRNLYKFWQIQEAGHNNIEHDQDLKMEYLNNLHQFIQSIIQ